MTVVTRFAPSPTGFLHIGGARTALFNWLFARHHGGAFRLRIEDTDRARSSEAAVHAIRDGLEWLGLAWDGEAVSQFAGAARHGEVARELLARGAAYRCWASTEELAEMRAAAKAEGRTRLYDGRWRNRDPAEAPVGVDPVIRIKAPREGETVVHDLVQGDVVTRNEQLDDMVLLRADGTPTYMLAVVVDDHDMGVSHVIRGDDHLTNAGRQLMIYQAMDWTPPAFAHIPLIHGEDGAKLSKRHDALAVQDYRDKGYLPDAICNYLLRLGWSHGDDEIFSRAQATEWFSLDAVNKGAARFDYAKLDSINAHYLRNAEVGELLPPLLAAIEADTGASPGTEATGRIERALPALTQRAKTLVELVDKAAFCLDERPLVPEEKAAKTLADPSGRALLAALREDLAATPWTPEDLEAAVKGFVEARELKLGKVAQPLRAALTGRAVSPGIYDVLWSLGREESLARLDDVNAD